MDTLFAIGVGAYGATTAGYLASLWTARPAAAEIARWLLRGTLAFWLVLLAWWAADAGTAGGTRLWIGFSAWSLGALYLFLLRRYPITALGSFISALATLLTILALVVARPNGPMVTGAMAQWLLRVHVGLAFIGVTAFAFASAVSAVYLIQARLLKRKSPSELRRRLPPLDMLDRMALRSIIVGFPFYTVALLLGSAEAVREGTGGFKVAYGLAVVSWIIYGVVLQARLTAGWRGRRAAVLTICGLVTALVVVALYSMGLA